eukprot:TRINITY_DN33795_c0_g1_i2.p1 TRINITY_DN33795_c0_g1~~TRINITY_DN33795_c0_g1_i2.p1  ORF type:complete len:535 (-),score=113.28 TRINITY_DN33795_c0_g1_i2:32-1636(-)
MEQGGSRRRRGEHGDNPRSGVSDDDAKPGTNEAFEAAFNAASRSAAEAAEAAAEAASAEAAAATAIEYAENPHIGAAPEDDDDAYYGTSAAPESWYQEGGWTCGACTQVNPMHESRCSGCGGFMGDDEEGDEQGWPCPACAMVNPLDFTDCANCGTRSPFLDTGGQFAASAYHHTEERERMGGACFWPCQSCGFENDPRYDECEACLEPRDFGRLAAAQQGSPMAPPEDDSRYLELSRQRAEEEERAAKKEVEERAAKMEAEEQEAKKKAEEEACRERLFQLHTSLLVQAKTPVERAALGKLKTWETADSDYSLAEVMDVVRFVEAQLYTEMPPRLTRLRRRAFVFLGILCVVLLMCCATSFGAFLSRVVTVQDSGLLDATGAGGGGGLAATGLAVQLHSLLRYPSLSDEELRLVRDVVLRHDSSFQFFRVALVSKTFSGGVRLEMEDGSSVRVEEGQVFLRRPWESEVVADMTEQDSSDASWDDAGAFFGYAPFWRGSGGGELPRLSVEPVPAGDGSNVSGALRRAQLLGSVA